MSIFKNTANVCFLFLLACGAALSGANAIKVESVDVPADRQQAAVRILLDSDAPLQGFSFAARYPDAPDTLTFEGVSLDDTLLAADALDAEYVMTLDKPAEQFVAVAVVMDFQSPYVNKQLPAGLDMPVCRLLFQLSGAATAGTVLPIDLRDDLGRPKVKPVFTVDDQSVSPELVDGALTIVSGASTLRYYFPQDARLCPWGSTFEILCDTDHVMEGYSICLSYPPAWMAIDDVTLSNTVAEGHYQLLWSVDVDRGVLAVGVTPIFNAGDIVSIQPGLALPILSVDAHAFEGACASSGGIETVHLSLEDHAPAYNRVALPDNSTVSPVLTDAEVPVDCNPIFLRGDANIDGKIDIGDPITVLKYLFSDGKLDCQDAADANDDGVLNLADPIYLLAYQFAEDKAPASPFPVCGVDPTTDDLPECRYSVDVCQ